MSLPTSLGCLTLLCFFGWGFLGTLGCNKNGTANCGFQHFFQNGTHISYVPVHCGWKASNFHSQYAYEKYFPFNYAVQLIDVNKTGELTSRSACSTGRNTHCLTFYYFFGVAGAFDLSVSVKYDRSADPEPPLWTLSSNPNPFEKRFFVGKVPIKTEDSFRVVFKARKRPGFTTKIWPTVWIDDIHYLKAACPVMPFTAKPPSPLPTTSSSTSNPTTSSSTSTAVGDEHVPEKGKIPIGLIAAVIIIVTLIITIFITFVIVVWFRRKRRAKAGRSAANVRNHVTNGFDDTQDSPRGPFVSTASDPGEERRASTTTLILNLSSLSGSSDDESSSCSKRPELTSDDANLVTIAQERPSTVRLGTNSATFNVQPQVDQVDRAPLPTGSDSGRGRDHPGVGSPAAAAAGGSNRQETGEDTGDGDAAWKTHGGGLEETGHYSELNYGGKGFAGGVEDGAVDCGLYSHVSDQGAFTHRQVDGDARARVIGNVYSHLEDQEDIYHHVQRTSHTQVIDNVYSHLDDQEDTYCRVGRNTHVEVIDNVYSHLDHQEDTGGEVDMNTHAEVTDNVYF